MSKEHQPTPDKPGPPSMIKGYSFKLLGIVLVFVGLICFGAVTVILRTNSLEATTLVFVGGLYPLNALLLLVGATSFNYGRRILLARKDEEELARDTRPPVLYLRSFRSERWTSMVPLGGATLFSLKTEEEELAQLMKILGPLVAIGQPGDELPQLGARRIYVNNLDWQPTVERLMKEARVVVLRAGDSEGFWWEVRKLVEIKKRPECILFLLPFAKADYEAFRAKAETILKCRLPDYKRGLTSCGTLKGLLYFEPDWTSQFVTFKSVFGFKAARSPIASRLHYALRPFFHQLLIKRENAPDYQPSTLATEPVLQLQNPALAKGIAGKYVNKKNHAEYIELHPDGTFYVRERNLKLAGSFDINNETLTLKLASGPKQTAHIREEFITDLEGKEWIKQSVIEADGSAALPAVDQPRAFAGSPDLFKSFQEPESQRLLSFLGSRLLLRVAVAIIPLLIIAGYFYYRSPKSVANANWITYKFSNSGLLVDLPCKPTFRRESQPRVESQTAEGCAFRDLSFHIESLVHEEAGALSPDLPSIALSLYANNLEQNVRRLPGNRPYEPFQSEIHPVSSEKYSLRCKYKNGVVPFALDAYATVQGQTFYLVAVEYSSSDEAATKAMTRIFSSVRLP